MLSSFKICKIQNRSFRDVGNFMSFKKKSTINYSLLLAHNILVKQEILTHEVVSKDQLTLLYHSIIQKPNTR